MRKSTSALDRKTLTLRGLRSKNSVNSSRKNPRDSRILSPLLWRPGCDSAVLPVSVFGNTEESHAPRVEERIALCRRTSFFSCLGSWDPRHSPDSGSERSIKDLEDEKGRRSLPSLFTTLITPEGVSNLIRDETREDPKGFFKSSNSVRVRCMKNPKGSSSQGWRKGGRTTE